MGNRVTARQQERQLNAEGRWRQPRSTTEASCLDHAPSKQCASSTVTIMPIAVSAVRVTDARWSNTRSQRSESESTLLSEALVNRTKGLTFEKLMPFKSAAKNLTSRTEAVRTWERGQRGSALYRTRYRDCFLRLAL